jgi:hypothetical protein
MPIQTANIDQTSSGVAAISITTNEMLTIATNVIVQSEAGDGIDENDGIAGTIQILNHGSISANGNGIFTNAASSNVLIDNFAGASIVGSIGIDISETHDTIVNAGSIVGTSTGIQDLAAYSLDVVNSGDIFGTEFGANLGPGGTLNNSGHIWSDDTGVVMDVSSFSSSIQNSGTIQGSHRAVAAYGSSQFTLVNKGTIDGDVNLTTSGPELITNTGRIDGSVELGSGFNTFNGRGGTVTGTITGGAGVDYIYLGNDGETADGGGGFNKLYAGAGADTFVYSALGSNTGTQIYGFNVNEDTIELNSSVFTKLTAGQTPTFSVGSAATSPTDYLFYNSTTGALYYDTNGSGAGQTHLLGYIGAHLQYTAANFQVV